MEIKVSEVMQREDNSLYLKEIEMINYEKGEILNTPDNVVKLMTDVFEINKKISEEIFVIALTTDSKPLHFFKLNRGTVNTSLYSWFNDFFAVSKCFYIRYCTQSPKW